MMGKSNFGIYVPRSKFYHRQNRLNKIVVWLGLLSIVNPLFLVSFLIIYLTNIEKTKEERRESYDLLLLVFGWILIAIVVYLFNPFL